MTEIGKAIGANIISIGMITELTGVGSYWAIEKALLCPVPPAFHGSNRRALHLGPKTTRGLK